MKTSEYMDKEITGLSRSRSDDLFGHGNIGEDYDYEDSLSPRFGFYPSSPPQSSAYAVGKTRSPCDEALLSLIDKRMKEHTSEVLHAVSGVSARLTQLESRTRRMEIAVDDLKESLVSHHGRTEGKLQELENLLREVQDFTRDIRDKQDIAEAQIHLTMLSMSKAEAHPKKPETAARTVSVQESASSISQQPAQQLPVPVTQTSTPPPHVNPSPASQRPVPPLPPPPLVLPPPPEVYYQIPSVPHSQPASVQPHHLPYQPPAVPPPRMHEHQQQPLMPAPPPSTQQAPSGVQRNEFLHYSPQMSGNSVHNLSYSPFIGGPVKQFEGLYSRPPEQPTTRRYSDYASHPSLKSDSNNLYGRSWGNPPMATCNPIQSSIHSEYSQLPTAQMLPQALPTVFITDPELSPDRSRNKEATDDVVDGVVAMGFRRDVVRATVKRLMDRGQLVDLNVVLDSLTHEGQNQTSDVRFR